MKIKSPLNFVIGIGCGVCLVLSIVRGRDMFHVSICAFSTVVNLFLGLVGEQDGKNS